MPWYRTTAGHLSFGEGDLAAVLEQHGGTEVDEETAVAEVESGEAQAAADEAAAAQDPTPPTGDVPAEDADPEPDGEQGEGTVGLTFDHTPYPPLSDEQQAMVDKAIVEETPPSGSTRRR